jgi:chemosensory pili system protein ChpA (sensor histidine kinase/response regulator)
MAESAPCSICRALLAQGRVVATVGTTAAVAHRPRIMVVDDSLSVRRVVTTALERQGWEAIQARNGQEALTLLTTTPIDAMLLDIEMPQMDGYSLLERLRSGDEYHHLPVAILTSRSADNRQRPSTRAPTPV